MEIAKEKQEIMPALRVMEIGEKIQFPVQRMNVVRTICYLLKRQNNLHFSTKQVNSNTALEVTRTA